MYCSSAIAFIRPPVGRSMWPAPARSGRDPLRILPAPLFRELLLVAARAEGMLTFQVAMARTDRERRRHGDVGEPEPLEGAAHEVLAGVRRRDALGHVEMQHGAAGVLRLQFLLPCERLER